MRGKTAAVLTSWYLCSLPANQAVTTTAIKVLCGISIHPAYEKVY